MRSGRVLALGALTLLGCKSKIELAISETPTLAEWGLIVLVNAKSKGKDVEGEGELSAPGVTTKLWQSTAGVHVPRASLKAGKQTIVIKLKMADGRTAETSVDYDYDPVVRVKVVGDTLECTNRLCSVELYAGEHPGLKAIGPKDAKLEVLGKTYPLEAISNDPKYRAMVSAPLAALPLALGEVAGNRPEVQLPVKVAFVDGAAATGTLKGRVELQDKLREVLSKVASGPVKFDKDTAAPSGPHKALFLVSPRGVWIRGTQPAHNRDIHLVALVKYKERPSPCGTYVSKSGASKDVSGTVSDGEVTVYERLTGKSLGSRAFPAPTPVCKDTMHVGESGPASIASEKELLAYADTFMK